MRIIYFDGHCNLCNGFVDYLLRHDKAGRLRFAPLQGETARARLPESLVKNLGTVVFEVDQSLYTESTAALRAVAELGGAHRMVMALIVIPLFLRDFVYRGVAKRRYRIWGQRDTCRLPTAQEAERFLN